MVGLGSSRWDCFVGPTPELALVYGSELGLFLTSTGQVFACGAGGFGRLGLNGRLGVSVPRLIEGLGSVRVVQVSAGASHSAFVTEEGAAFTCGDDSCGWVYLDTSPRRNRIWCTAAGCGNRNRVKRHHARTRA